MTAEEDLERNLLAVIEELQNQYRRAIEPYVKQLVMIRACRPPTPIIITGPAELPKYIVETIGRIQETPK